MSCDLMQCQTEEDKLVRESHLLAMAAFAAAVAVLAAVLAFCTNKSMIRAGSISEVRLVQAWQ